MKYAWKPRHVAMAFALSGLFAARVTNAQQTASVAVNASSSLSTLAPPAFGVNTAVWDSSLLDAAVPNLLKSAGVTAIRFPGGSTSDVYHWQDNSSTNGTGQYVNPANTFDAFMGVVQKTGAQPIITVNYGSNKAGNAGGDPAEAAAWVQYANKTKNYGIKYWEVGNELYGNGEYGAAWEEDLHSDHSPTAYGSNVVQFANQMKAADPTIKVGAVLTSPGDWPDGQNPSWNQNVLAACGTKIDFVIVHWYAQGPGSENDAGLLSSTSSLAGKVSALRALINQYCGSNAPNVQILVTETNSVSYNPGKQSVSLVNALFLADDFATWLENGVTNVDWWDLHNGIAPYNNNSSGLYGSAPYGDYGLLSSGQSGNGVSEPAVDTPFPPYYGLQMLNKLGKPGDAWVAASSNNSKIAAHAIKQANGSLALLLVNKDPSNTYSVSVSLSGYTPASSATVYTYGINSSGIASSSRTGVSSSFTQSLAPYSLTTLVLTGSGAPVPAFVASAVASPTTIAPGGSVALTATVKDTGSAYSNALVDVEIWDANNNKVNQQVFQNQNFTAGQTRTYPTNWTASSTPGTYTVKVGVFNADWSQNFVWNGSAATTTVANADPAQYNFESGTQGWASSGGMITGVASSTAQVFAGSHSLAVNFNGSGADSQMVFVSAPATPAGKTLTFHLWIPVGSKVSAVQPYVLQGAGGGWAWTGNYQSISSLTPGAWNTLTVTVPGNAVTPLYSLGVQFFTSGAWSGTVYVDSIGW